MLGTLQNLFFKKGGYYLTENIIVLYPSIILSTLKVFSTIKKSFMIGIDSFYFLIDGRITNSKKSLLSALSKIYILSNKLDKKKSPFLLIAIINLKNITLENQSVFGKFLTKNSVLMKFVFFVNNLKYLNEVILLNSTIIDLCRFVFYKKKYSPTNKLISEKINNYVKRKKIDVFYLKKNKILNINNSIFRFDKNFIKIQGILVKMGKRFANEIFYLFLNRDMSHKYKKIKTDVTNLFLKNISSYNNQHYFYKILSFRFGQKKII